MLRMEKQNVIKNNRTGKIYFDSGTVRDYETLLAEDMTWEEARTEYPEIIKV